jgi:hypothetical protein
VVGRFPVNNVDKVKLCIARRDDDAEFSIAALGAIDKKRVGFVAQAYKVVGLELR